MTTGSTSRRRATRPCGTNPRSTSIPAISRTLRVGLIAALSSGAPSTAYAIATGRDPLEASAAAGTLLLGPARPRAQLVAAAVPVHAAVSLLWTIVLDATLPQRRRRLAGALAGLGVAWLDLVVVGKRFPRIAAL